MNFVRKIELKHVRRPKHEWSSLQEHLHIGELFQFLLLLSFGLLAIKQHGTFCETPSYIVASWTRGEPIKNGTAIKAFYSRVNIKDFSIAKININCDWHHKSFGGLFTSSIVPPLTGATCGRYKKNTSRPTPSDPLLLTDRERPID